MELYPRTGSGLFLTANGVLVVAYPLIIFFIGKMEFTVPAAKKIPGVFKPVLSMVGLGADKGSSYVAQFYKPELFSSKPSSSGTSWKLPFFNYPYYNYFYPGNNNN